MLIDPRQLTSEQKQMLLKDENNNGIPDMFEHGVLPEDIGISTGQPFDPAAADTRRKQLKFFSKFIRVSMLRRLFAVAEHPGQAQDLAKKNNQTMFRALLPYFIVTDIIIIGIILYFVFK